MLFQRAFVASCFAWMVSVISFPFLWWSAAKADGISLPLIGTLWDGLFGVSLFGAVVVFSTCLLVVTPLLSFLPLTSRLWRPRFALGVGALVGPLAMYLWNWMLGASREINYVFKHPDGKAQMLSAVCAGAVFGYALAKRYARQA